MLDGWHDVLRAYAKQFGIAKLENVVSGGRNGQDSIRNGLYDIVSRHTNDDDIVLIHDAIRPMVSAEVITDNIRVCRQYGNAITVVPCTAAMLKTFDSLSTEEPGTKRQFENHANSAGFLCERHLQCT